MRVDGSITLKGLFKKDDQATSDILASLLMKGAKSAKKGKKNDGEINKEVKLGIYFPFLSPYLTLEVKNESFFSCLN